MSNAYYYWRMLVLIHLCLPTDTGVDVWGSLCCLRPARQMWSAQVGGPTMHCCWHSKRLANDSLTEASAMV
jgi:hypothetical protein